MRIFRRNKGTFSGKLWTLHEKQWAFVLNWYAISLKRLFFSTDLTVFLIDIASLSLQILLFLPNIIHFLVRGL